MLGLALLRWPAAYAAGIEFHKNYPYVILGAGLVLGWRFARGRLVAALVTLAAAERALELYGASSGPTGLLTESVALLLPVNLAVLPFLPDVGLFSRLGRLWVAALCIQIVAVALVVRVAPPSIVSGLALPVFPVDALDLLRLPQLVILAFAGATMLIGFRVARTNDPTAPGIGWATVASFVALNSSSTENRTLYFATAGLALIVGMVEASYALAFRDELTGLPGRRAFNHALNGLNGSYVVAMIDVDHFKQFNDRHGHDVGDQVLKLVANRLAAMSGGGKGFRYGGEEFAVLFPSTLAQAEPYLEALRKDIEATTFMFRGQDRPRKADATRRRGPPQRKDLSVTVSIGAAEAGSPSDQGRSVVEAADRAMYRAKDTGRNRVVTTGG